MMRKYQAKISFLVYALLISGMMNMGVRKVLAFIPGGSLSRCLRSPLAMPLARNPAAHALSTKMPEQSSQATIASNSILSGPRAAAAAARGGGGGGGSPGEERQRRGGGGQPGVPPAAAAAAKAAKAAAAAAPPEGEEEGPLVVDADIILRADEAKLFRLLLRASRERGLGTTLRVAGGWVRDKLLEAGGHWAVKGLPAGSQSVDTSQIDIDVALDNMVGAAFADEVNDWLQHKGRQTKSVAIVAKNPEKSKHLETATMKISGFSLDFVNLRTETYTDEASRIPSMAIGSPAEDALRRDLTINALFYNINTGKVEDWTRRGLADLRGRVVRTPLPARTTFLDDPLRVLRAVRFAGRLGFTVDEELLGAASSKEVHQALLLKVSRERIGSEVEGMMAGRAPLHSFHIIVGLGLGPIVFPFPPMMTEPPPPPMRVFQTSLLHMTHMTALLEGGAQRMRAHLPPTDLEKRMGLYAAFLWPFRHLRYSPLDGAGGRKKGRQGARTEGVIYFLMQEMLKRPARERKAVETIQRAAEQFSALVAKREYGPVGRVELGRVLVEAGELWQVAMLMGLAVDQSRARGDGTCESEMSLSYVKYHMGWMRKYEALAREIEALGLVGVWDMKPLVDGNAMKEIFRNIPKGKAFTELMDAQKEWMLEHQEGTREQLVTHLTQEFQDFL